MSSFGEWLTDELTRRGWSHNELARRAGVSQPNVSGIINGRSPGCDFCIRVAQALELSPVLLLVKAGILPPQSPDDDSTIQELVELVRSLPPEDRKDVLQFARFRHQNSRKD